MYIDIALLITLLCLLAGIAVAWGTVLQQIRDMKEDIKSIRVNHLKHLTDVYEELDEKVTTIQMDVAVIKTMLEKNNP